LIKRILVALDGSEAADKALDHALDIAEKYSADILLLSVVQPVVAPQVAFSPAAVPPVPPMATVNYSKNLREQHEKMLSEALKKVKKLKLKINVSTKLVEGRPSDKIVETSRKEGFDLLVMGSRGLGGIKEFFLGSVSDRVADEAPCPVLIVKSTRSKSNTEKNMMV
jgi:nucleotide-binding universal stress UspA family protein